LQQILKASPSLSSRIKATTSSTNVYQIALNAVYNYYFSVKLFLNGLMSVCQFIASTLNIKPHTLQQCINWVVYSQQANKYIMKINSCL